MLNDVKCYVSSVFTQRHTGHEIVVERIKGGHVIVVKCIKGVPDT
jgi:hypothetical protein